MTYYPKLTKQHSRTVSLRHLSFLFKITNTRKSNSASEADVYNQIGNVVHRSKACRGFIVGGESGGSLDGDIA